LPNVAVTFQVASGGGNIGGQQSYTTNTDGDGRALAILTLGPNDGIANNLVQATFPGNPGFPAAFNFSGRTPGDPAATIIKGVVLDNSNNPVPGATIRVYLQNVPAQVSNGLPPSATATSDANGQFLIQPAPVGFVKLLVDGSTIQKPGKWPNLEYELVTVSGQTNTLGMPVYLLPIDTQHQVCVSDTVGGNLTLPQVPGFALTVQAGSATFPGGSKSGCISVTPVHPDKIPMVPGFGQQPKFIVTIQPAGTLFNPPAQITIPNADALKPGEITEMYGFDHDLGMFVSIGTGTASADGTVITSDRGVGVVKAGWFCGGPPADAGGAGTCPTCRTCNGTDCVPQPLCSNSGGCPAGSACDGSGNCKSGEDLIPKICNQLKVAYGNPSVLPCNNTPNTCGAGVQYDVTNVTHSCDGIDMKGAITTEIVSNDHGCFPVNVQGGPGCTVVSGNRIRNNAGGVCTDQYVGCGPPELFPIGTCTETITQQVYVDTCLAQTTTIKIKITRTATSCTGTVTRN
jgi:hypothetical protein